MAFPISTSRQSRRPKKHRTPAATSTSQPASPHGGVTLTPIWKLVISPRNHITWLNKRQYADERMVGGAAC